MTLSDADAFLAAQKRSRRRALLVPLAMLGAGALVALGFYVRRVRTVWFKAPDHAVVLHLADRDPIALGPDMMFGARLRPGTYKLTVEGAPDALTEVRVPYTVNSTLAVPLTSDQCFVIANAAGLYALDHNIDRLADDHANARVIADRLSQSKKIVLDRATVQTNILVFGLTADAADAPTVVSRAKERGVLIFAFGPRTIRAVTHLDVSRQECERAADVLLEIVG